MAESREWEIRERLELISSSSARRFQGEERYDPQPSILMRSRHRRSRRENFTQYESRSQLKGHAATTSALHFYGTERASRKSQGRIISRPVNALMLACNPQKGFLFVTKAHGHRFSAFFSCLSNPIKEEEIQMVTVRLRLELLRHLFPISCSNEEIHATRL